MPDPLIMFQTDRSFSKHTDRTGLQVRSFIYPLFILFDLSIHIRYVRDL